MPMMAVLHRSIDRIRDYLFGGGYPNPAQNAEQLSFPIYFYILRGGGRGAPARRAPSRGSAHGDTRGSWKQRAPWPQRRVRLQDRLAAKRYPHVPPVESRRMTDIAARRRRSETMGGIRERKTAPQRAVRRIAHRMRLRIRLHREGIPGRPDLVFPGHRLIVFIHGCFRHRHEGFWYASTPTSRIAFWTAKFAANAARDARQQAALRALRWRLIIISECKSSRKAAVERRPAGLIRSWSTADRESTQSVAVMKQQAPTARVGAPTLLRLVSSEVASGSRAASTVEIGLCGQPSPTVSKL